MAGQAADIESFRAQLVASKVEEKKLRDKLGEAERATRQITVEPEQLRVSLTNWVNAVNERDKQLENTATQVKELLQSRDDAIEKYNALAKTHNRLVADFNRSVTNATTKN